MNLEKERSELVNNEDAPKLIEKEEIKVITRDKAIDESPRIFFENENIIGSISLNGGVIDDLTFKKYTTTVEGDEKVILLNPKNEEAIYYLAKLKLDNSDYKKSKELNERLINLCSKFCSESKKLKIEIENLSKK